MESYSKAESISKGKKKKALRNKENARSKNKRPGRQINTRQLQCFMRGGGGGGLLRNWDCIVIKLQKYRGSFELMRNFR